MNATQKQERIKRAIRHAEQDLLISGEYIRVNGKPKGCSVGCDAIDIQLANGIEVENLDGDHCHSLVADNDGTPEWLERLRDTVFEGLEESDRHWWHVELAKSLPETDNWKPYFHAISIEILKLVLENKDYWQDPYSEMVESAINQTIDYHNDHTEDTRSAAWSAWSAARSAARSAWSAEGSAEGPAEGPAQSAAWEQIANDLIECVEGAAA